jgi:hypothetical protein
MMLVQRRIIILPTNIASAIVDKPANMADSLSYSKQLWIIVRTTKIDKPLKRFHRYSVNSRTIARKVWLL